MGIALLDATVFVGDGQILEKAVVLVDRDRIVKVDSKGASIPRDARKIPLDGRILMPGFIDCHVHLCLDASIDPINSLAAEAVPLTSLKAAKFAEQTLMAGITTVRDMGGKNGIDLIIRDSVSSGLIPGPRILGSRQMICMTGGHGWPIGREADGPDEVAKAVREQIKAGADVAKIMATGGVLTMGVESGAAQFTEEEMRAGIAEAHKANRKTGAHAMGTQGILNALRAGIDSLEHGTFLSDEAISFMLKNAVFYVPTLTPVIRIDETGIEAGIPAWAVEKNKRNKPNHIQSVRMAHEAGVAIAVGSDAGTPFNHHGNNLRELKCLTDVGLSPMEVLEAATKTAAQVLGLESDLGTIEEGKLADLVVLEVSPLEDAGVVSNAKAVSLVMIGGRLVKDDLHGKGGYLS